MSKKYFIVWNDTRSEGFITQDQDDAEYTATGISTSFGVTTVGDSFRETYADGEEDAEFDIQEIEIQTN